ncbi:MAG: DNA repair protein RecN, partial [Oceanococcus sp.]
AQSALQQLQQLCEIDPRFEAALKLCDQAQIDIKEAASLCEDLASDIDPDPQALQAVSQRLDSYQSQARKHRVQPEDLGTHWQQLQNELKHLESGEQDLQALKQQREALTQQYQELSLSLSKARQQAAKTLGTAISEAVRPLGLPHAACEIVVEWQSDAKRSPHGQDRIELRVAMNPGHQAAPLAKVASGGELARTSLAIQVVCLNQSPVPVLLFDEVDVGIGGGVAETVGRRLKDLAAGYQVFCVTHQPQVAALADTHFQVSKQVVSGQTQTEVHALTETNRIEELARMLGGVNITAQTRSHAQEMLELGGQ